MKLLGLTGGIAMGKSTAAQMFGDGGCAVADTDLLARQAVEPGAPALAEIVDAFGPDYVDDAGRLRRADLARLVFHDVAVRQRLEGILHPRIRALWRGQVEDWRAAGRRAAVVVIPLLFETEAAADFDAIVCAVCTRVSQRERLAARGWTPSEAEARLRAQWPVERKLARSDFVIWTEGSLVVTREQVDRILRQLNLHPSSPSVRLCAEKLVP
jgi:dephospho-CoA kinase